MNPSNNTPLGRHTVYTGHRRQDGEGIEAEFGASGYRVRTALSDSPSEQRFITSGRLPFGVKMGRQTSKAHKNTPVVKAL